VGFALRGDGEQGEEPEFLELGVGERREACGCCGGELLSVPFVYRPVRVLLSLTFIGL
jgi:hypothetical protein